MVNEAVIISAPSGAGKTTIVKHLLSVFRSWNSLFQLQPAKA